MARRWFRSSIKPDLRAELRAILGHDIDVSSAALGRALANDGTNRAGLVRALANALRGEDETYQIEVVRKKVGNPGGFIRAESPLEILAYFEEQLGKGVPRKAAIEDACFKFSISRATVYQRLKLARRQREDPARTQIPALRTPGGNYIERSKRALHRKKRKRTPKKKRLGVVIHPGIMQKLTRRFRISKKSADRLDE